MADLFITLNYPIMLNIVVEASEQVKKFVSSEVRCCDFHISLNDITNSMRCFFANMTNVVVNFLSLPIFKENFRFCLT